MRRIFFIGFVLMIAASSASADEPRANYSRGVLTGPGYRDRALSPSSWKVTSAMGGAKPYYLTEKVALYRAAELAESAGFKFLRIDKKKAERSTRGFSAAGARVELFVTGSTEPAAIGHCENNVSIFTCSTFLVSAAKLETSPFLNFPKGR